MCCAKTIGDIWGCQRAALRFGLTPADTSRKAVPCIVQHKITSHFST